MSNAAPILARRRLPKPDVPQVRVVDISPTLAERWIGQNDRNRSVSDRQVNQFARDMLAGKWMFVGDPIRRASDGTLLDGQHRLHAIVRSGCTIKCVVVDDLDPDSQIVMDTGRKRTFGDNLKIAGEKKYPLLASITRRLVQWRHGEVLHNNYQPTMTELNEQFAEDPEGIGVAADVGNHLRSVIPILPTAAGLAFYLCSQSDMDAASQFFGRLADGVDLSAGDPIHTLRARLTRSAVNNERLEHGEQLYLVIRAWNAWRRGEKLTKLQLPTSGLSNPTFPRPS